MAGEALQMQAAGMLRATGKVTMMLHGAYQPEWLNWGCTRTRYPKMQPCGRSPAARLRPCQL